MTNEQMKAYAERYEWLRRHSWVEQAPASPAIYFGRGYSQSKPNILDKLLDAQIEQTKEFIANPKTAAEKDADRYRWLRDTANKEEIEAILLGRKQYFEIDKAIDDVIAS